MPAKYLRQHVTSFLSENSYNCTSKSATAVRSSQAQPEQSAKAAIKVEVASANEAQQQKDVPSHMSALPSHASRITQLDVDRNTSMDANSPPPPPPPPPQTQSHIYQSHQSQTNHVGSGQPVSMVDNSRMSGYQQPAVRQTVMQPTVHSDMSQGACFQPPSSNLGYQQSMQVTGVNVGQSLSAPSLLSHAHQAE